MFCPKCGAKNEDTDKFCMRCGQSLPSTDSFKAAANVGSNQGVLAHSSLGSWIGGASSIAVLLSCVLPWVSASCKAGSRWIEFKGALPLSSQMISEGFRLGFFMPLAALAVLAMFWFDYKNSRTRKFSAYVQLGAALVTFIMVGLVYLAAGGCNYLVWGSGISVAVVGALGLVTGGLLNLSDLNRRQPAKKVAL